MNKKLLQQEPVAWMRISKCGQGVFDLYDFSANHYDEFDTPLYRHPPSADAERLLIFKAIGDAGLILIKTHLGFELIKKGLVIAQTDQHARGESLQESSYRAGAKAGYNLGVIENQKGLADLLEAHRYPMPSSSSQSA